MYKMNLHLFGESEKKGEPAPVAEEQKAGKVVYGKVDKPEEEPVAEVKEKPTLKELIEGEYKDEFTAFFQEKFNERHKDHKVLESKVGEYEKIVQRVAEKYGISEINAEKVLNAIDEDETYYEKEALEKGMTIEQLKDFKRIERERNELKREKEERDRQNKAAQIQSKWRREEEEVKRLYPNFNMAEEVKDQRFVGLITNNIDLKTAYEVVHREQILDGTIEKVSKAVRQDIKARGSRPLEEGASSSPSITIKDDPKSWTPEDFEDVRRRVQKGEKIKL